MSGHNKKHSPGERSEFFERLALGAGLVVVIGLLVESGPEIAKSILDRTWPPRQVVGGILVTLGVAGEVIFSWRAMRMARLAESEADERVAKAEQAAAEANRLTERERTERIKLEQELTPRWFENQHEAIERLKQFNGTVVVLRYPPDIECARTAEQIAFVLNEAGWNIQAEPVLQLNPLCEEGITIEAVHGPIRPTAGTALMDVLTDAELDAKWPPGVGPRTETPVIVWVGMKPHGLSSRINRHTAAMDREVRQVLESLAGPTIPDISRRIQDAMDRYHAALNEETKDLKPGMAGGRLQLPRWPVTPPQA